MTDQQNVPTDFDQIMSSVADLNKQHITKLYVPSLNDEINFQPLTVKQQKRIISSSMDPKTENLAFSNTVNDIILENCLEKKDKLILTDKILLLLHLRSRSMGSRLVVNVDEEEYEVDLAKHIEDVIEVAKTHNKHMFEVSVESLKIFGGTPTLSVDTEYNKEFTKTV